MLSPAASIVLPCIAPDTALSIINSANRRVALSSRSIPARICRWSPTRHRRLQKSDLLFNLLDLITRKHLPRLMLLALLHRSQNRLRLVLRLDRLPLPNILSALSNESRIIVSTCSSVSP